MGYLVCQECGGYYKLQEGESKDDFVSCECYGTLVYVESIEDYFNPDEQFPDEVKDKSSDDVLKTLKNESTTSVTENLDDNSSDSYPEEPGDRPFNPILEVPGDRQSAPIFEKPGDKSPTPILENKEKKDSDIKSSALPEEMADTPSKISINSEGDSGYKESVAGVIEKLSTESSPIPETKKSVASGPSKPPSFPLFRQPEGKQTIKNRNYYHKINSRDKKPDVKTLKLIKDVNGLIAALDFDDSSVKLEAVKALGSIADERAIEPLKKVKEKEKGVLRTFAGNAIFQIESKNKGLKSRNRADYRKKYYEESLSPPGKSKLINHNVNKNRDDLTQIPVFKNSVPANSSLKDTVVTKIPETSHAPEENKNTQVSEGIGSVDRQVQNKSKKPTPIDSKVPTRQEIHDELEFPAKPEVPIESKGAANKDISLKYPIAETDVPIKQNTSLKSDKTLKSDLTSGPEAVDEAIRSSTDRKSVKNRILGKFRGPGKSQSHEPVLSDKSHMPPKSTYNNQESSEKIIYEKIDDLKDLKEAKSDTTSPEVHDTDKKSPVTIDRTIDRDVKSGKTNETNKETNKKIPDDHFIPEDSSGIQDDLLTDECLFTSESTSQIKSSANDDSLEVNEPVEVETPLKVENTFEEEKLVEDEESLELEKSLKVEIPFEEEKLVEDEESLELEESLEVNKPLELEESSEVEETAEEMDKYAKNAVSPEDTKLESGVTSPEISKTIINNKPASMEVNITGSDVKLNPTPAGGSVKGDVISTSDSQEFLGLKRTDLQLLGFIALFALSLVVGILLTMS
ncbi:HEAT repeat domain-containing protein [Methanobacterium sp. BAmetb5]|uniref:HEAT repeat domain-containing protein n=1 Tax=Methanobacterium sp. BAmetb5 TaxID=2025351 RepID=UPI000E884F44|nr:HEAT repeat domain-containing protein [Methanobacterium sp. BAmetb5]AXV39046.1 MAG: hypothetical protein CIT02_01325 [Methanobacterium sp. BAmetb5]